MTTTAYESKPTHNSNKHNKIVFVLALCFIFIFTCLFAWKWYMVNHANKSMSEKENNVLAPTKIPSPTRYLSPTATVLPPPSATPTPVNWSPPERPSVQACSFEGDCMVFPLSDAKQYCPKTYSNNRCDNECGNPANRCKAIVPYQ